jgi:hypothetical protein
MPTPVLPPIPQQMPKTQAEWQAFVNVMLAWQTVLGPLLPLLGDAATTATAGAHGSLPATVEGYLTTTRPDGVTVKVPYYKP